MENIMYLCCMTLTVFHHNSLCVCAEYFYGGLRYFLRTWRCSRCLSKSLELFTLAPDSAVAMDCTNPLTLSCSSGLFFGSCDLFTWAHKKLGSLSVSWEALLGNYLEQLLLPKEVHTGSPTTEQKGFWNHFWYPYSKTPKGMALLGQADGLW